MSDSQDSSVAFLDSMPEIAPDTPFRFRCHPGVACFNRCCSELSLMLTPYDVLRLRHGLHDMGSDAFLKQHARVGMAPDTGFPGLHLNMADAPGAPCPFVTDAGCSVYGNRPSACRTYPIGRATRYDENGALVEQFFAIREPHCLGFNEDADWTTATWATDQGLDEYNRFNDRYVALLHRHQGRPPLAPRQATMALLALYQSDTFQTFIANTHMFSRLTVAEADQQAILADEERCLDFALDWVELVLYGDCPRLAMKE
ncbi:MAG: YkgJ family cysteine cluster protein [Desulfovibrionaceae bacterium]